MTWEPPSYQPMPPGMPPPPPPYGNSPYPPNPYATPQGAGPQWPGGFNYSAAPKRRSTGWTVAAIAGGLVVILLIVAGVTAWHRGTTGAKNATSAYLTDLQDGQYVAAYQMLCTSDLLAVPESTFVTAKAAIHPVSFSIRSVALRSVAGADSATVYYDETRSDGTGGGAALSLVKVAGVWRPCHGGQGGSWLNQDCGCTSSVDYPVGEPSDVRDVSAERSNADGSIAR